jgi:hypothetical protein
MSQKRQKLLDLAEFEKEWDSSTRKAIKERLSKLCGEIDTVSPEVIRAELKLAFKLLMVLD